MTRDQIIARTLEDMRGYEWPHRDEFYRQSEEAAELGRYDQEITIPELMKRLPDADILTCRDFEFPVECCEICHYFYAHYDMEIVEHPDGRKAWICCSVHRALSHEPKRSDDSQEVNFAEALGGTGIRDEH